MATIKSFSDLPQSKKLAEILPLESADMRYEYPSIEKDEIQEPMIGFHTSSFNWFKESDSFIYFPCWSLASLLNVLPYLQLSKDKLGSGKVGWMISVYPNDCRYDSCWHDNPIDACMDMVEKLNELNLL